MREGFIATCRHCGAPHSLPLLDATAPCAYCHRPDPLDDAAQSRVEVAAAKVCQLAARAQQQESTRDGHSLEIGLMAAAFAIPSWLLFGGIALGMVYSEKPSSLSLWQLLHTEQIGGGNTPETGTVLAFWMLFLILAGVGLSLLTVFTALFFVRKPLPPPRALPPLDEQSPPRCYLCGAGLPHGNVTRRCKHCGTSNLVDGRAFDAQISAMHEQLSWLDHAIIARSVAAGSAADKLIMASAFYPITLLLALPLSMIGTPRTAPELVPALYALFALVALSILAWLTRWSSNARHLSDLTAGSALRIKGRAYTVVGSIEVTKQTLAGASHLLVLHPAHDQSPDLAMNLADTREKLQCFELRPGGAPLDPSQPPPSAALSLSTAQGATSAVATDEESPRVFTGNLITGTQPLWTLSKLSVPRDDVLLL